MNENLKNILDSLLPVVGQKGIDTLSAKLAEISGTADSPWKQGVLRLVADAVSHYGPEGLSLAQKKIDALLDSKPVQLDFSDLATASDLVAYLENAEADRRTAAKDFAAKVGGVLTELSGAVLKGVLTLV